MYCGLHIEKYLGIPYLNALKKALKYLENQIIMADRLIQASTRKTKRHQQSPSVGMMLSSKHLKLNPISKLAQLGY